MSDIARFIISIMFVIIGGLVFCTTKKLIDSSWYYLCGFIVGIIAGKIY